MRRATTTIACTVALTVSALLTACTGTVDTQVQDRKVEREPSSTTTTRPPDCAEILSPGAQAGQLVMVMVTGPQLAADVLTAGQAGGFGLKGRQSAEVGEEVAAAIAEAPVAPFVASDEEGGTVQRLSAALDDLPSAETMAEDTPEAAAALMQPYATSMRELGFNMNFGPVADVGSGSDLGSRSFGDDPAVVASFSDAVIGAQQAGGLISVVKHWPGIGGGNSDPHEQLDSLAPIEELRARDLLPFDAAIAAGAPAIMVAHAEIPNLTAPGEPASLSRAAITDELRGRQGFSGLVITDSLGMGAIVETTPQDEAAERAIAAGADIALVSGAEVVPVTHARLTEAITSGRLPKDRVVDSVRRVLAAKGVEGACPDLAAKLATLQQDVSTSLPTGTGDVDSDINGSSGSGGSSSGASSATSTPASKVTATTTAPTTTAKRVTTTTMATTTSEVTTTVETTTTEVDADPTQADIVGPEQ
jgi:beta-N-acetylhexosaminidase